MYKIFIGLILIVSLSQISYGQLYQGPANGSVPNGVTVNTNNFITDISGEPISPYIKKPRNEAEETIKPLPDYLNTIPAAGPEGSNFVQDVESGISSPIVLRKFAGIPETNSIPPDTYIAAGPAHLMGVVNSRFYIWDKRGVIISNINATSWFSSSLSGVSPFDPKVSYDHFNKRWIMVWLDQNDNAQRGYYLVSVSDDSIPTGVWYNWAIKSSLNGNEETGTWGDYQGVGFDNQAIYLTSNQFQFLGGFRGTKIRIIGKAQLYNNTAGPLVWTDLWDLRDPGNTSARTFGTRPSVIYGNPDAYYFLCNGPFETGTYVVMYKLVNPLTSPVMTGVNVQVTSYSSPPLADQLGGSTIFIETGGSGFKNEPTYRNGFLYAVHSVGSGGGVYSAVSYYKINVTTNTVVDDYAFGADGFWHFYPSLVVDKDQNIGITYSRSGLTEYIGACYNSRLNTDPPGTFSGTKFLKAGEAYYVKDFGSGRNRWGDYMGMWIDPSDENNMWIHTEYAKAPINTWANEVGLIRLVPFNTARIFSSQDTVNFGTKEVTTQSDTLKLSVYNYGSQALTISSIQNFNTQFAVLNQPALPLNLNFRDSLTLQLVYRPASAGNLKDSLKFTSNDPVNQIMTVYLKGRGYIINPVQANLIYGITGTQSGGILLSINSVTGAGTSIGASGYSQLNGLSIRPSNNQLYASITASPLTQLLRVNSLQGDAYPVSPIPVANIRSLAFDLNDVLYCSTSDGKLYQYNLSSGDTDFVGNTSISNLFGLSFNPLNGQLWGISASGAVYKISKQTAVSQTIGSTGVSPNTDIAFSKTGILYGVSGIGGTINRLIRIDTSNGSGSVIGTNTGYAGINGISISPEIVGIQNITTNIPDSYELYQNYPNPFNPVTNIRFDLPSGSNVKLIVYDILGKEVNKLVDEKLEAGSYEYSWNAADLSSGVYFYRIQTDPSSGGGEFFTEVRRMILIK